MILRDYTNKEVFVDKNNKITNDNELNNPSNDIYENFNNFIFSDDLKLTGKMLHRFKHFLNIKHLPGDIVEVGVFKGSGMATFLKFIQIFCPNSNKKVIGFDIFDTIKGSKILDKDTILDKENMKVVYDRVKHNELTYDAVDKRIKNIKVDKYKLIDGDVELTMPKFINENPGFRAALIYIDVDLERPTYHTLINMWDRLLPGGVILFDEYEYHSFSESNGVEKFLKEKQLEYDLISTDWIAPTAYLYKKSL
jgi:hypothetical protein